MNFNQLLTDYIKNGSSTVLKKRTRMGYMYRLPAIIRYFKEHYGAATHSQLTLENVREYQRWRDDKVSTSQKDKEFQVLRLIIRRALFHELIPKDFSDSIYKYKPRQTNKSRAVIPPENLEDIFEKAKKYVSGKRFLAFYLGHILLLRPAELLSLRMEDVDFDKLTIRIRGTKTDTSDGTLPLPDNAVEVMRPYVFGKGRLFKYSKGWLINLYKYMSDDCGLFDKNITPHKARKNMATFLMSKGVDIKTVQTLGRWKSPDVLLNIYAQPSSTQVRKAVNYLLPNRL